jgi:hypothetical protein
VDIAPTIARFLNINIPPQAAMEMDGIPLIGAVAVADFKVNHFQDKLDVSWKALDNKEVARIWVTATNSFKEGEKDDYKLMAEVPVKDEHALLDMSQLKSSFYKVVIEVKDTFLNKWIVTKENAK